MPQLKGDGKRTEKLRSVRKPKSHSNMPANLKISIPLQSTEQEGLHVPIVKGRRPPQFTKHLDIETKVNLANSVARQQLVKEEPPVFQTDNVVIIQPPKGRGRKKKVVSDFFQNSVVMGNNTAEKLSPGKKSTPIKKTPPTRKILTRKRLADSKAQEDAKRSKVETKTDTEACVVFIKLEDNTHAVDVPIERECDPIVEPVPTVVEPAPVVVQPTSEVVRRQPRKTKSSVKRLQPIGKKPPTMKQPTPGRKRAPKGKQQNVQPRIETPSIVDLLKNKVTESEVKTELNQQNAQELVGSRRNSVGSRSNLLRNKVTEYVVKTKPNQHNAPELVESRKSSVGSSPNLLRNKVTESVVKTKQNQQNAPGLVESRKNSVGSTSNKSWTRDISSSSNNTCIGSVCSNDFVRINMKLPILKLTNIDSEVKKRQNEAQEIAASAAADETDEDLSDSYDSDSSDSERKYSEQLNDSLGANSLHLSASSSSQFTQSRRKESSSDYPRGSSSDYGKAANKLSVTMEKLDLEIIKWMNSENENVNANLVKFRDKMFDILDREFGVITHCRHLKEILNPPKKGGSIDETCISNQVQDCDANNDTENVLVEENTLVVEKAQMVEKSPAIEKAPVVERAPVVEKAPVVEIAPVAEKAPVVDKAPVVERAPVVETVEKNTPVEKYTSELVKDFVEPRRRPSRHLSNTSEGNISNASTKASQDVTSDDEQAAGTSYAYYDHHDDDDTLSLFAESISGFESSRMATSMASVVVSKPHQVEEYIPKPARDVPTTEKHTYCPTKIREDPEIIASKIINVCEKQNADSTSIYKQSNSTDDAESYQDFNENIDLDTRLGPMDMIKKPRLMDSYFEGLPKASIVFGNLCFYNLMNCCRNMFYGQCRFLHMVPTSAQIKDKLNHLDDRMLIQEYLKLRKWSELRRRYGMCYVEECAKRGLTRVLIEIAYDFIVKASNESEEDTQLRVNTIEVTLLHLNTVDLSICEDLLKLTIHSDQVNRTLLCDVFMATMSITQNFSRFKSVFLNLTYFMVDNDRTFNKDVVEHILERVCILPFEDPIARALIQMMRLTKSDIFNNSMIRLFEKQISVNKDVFEEYTLVKNQWAFSSMLASSVVSASPPLQATQVARPDRPAERNRHDRPDQRDRPDRPDQRDRPDGPAPPDPQPPAASPDTTNLDNMQNKAIEELSKPVITRTIGMNPAIIFNRGALSSGDSQACVSPSLSKSFGNSGLSKSFVNPGLSKSFVNSGLSKSFSNPGPSRFHVNNTESDTSDESVKLNIRKWRNRSIFPHVLPPLLANRGSMRSNPTRGSPTRGTMRPPMRPQMRPPQRSPFNQRQVTFKSPSNYVNRQPGPKY